MIITRTSLVSKRTKSMDLDITAEQLTNWGAGMLVQDAFPNLSEDEREFIMTGVTSEEWNELFGEEL